MLSNVNGKASLELQNDSIDVLTTINLKDACIEVYMPEPFDKGVDQEYRDNLIENDLTLRNCSFKLMDGSTIKAELLSKLSVKHYKPATIVSFDTKIDRMFNLTGKLAGVASLKLVPRDGNLNFKIDPPTDKYEIVYLNNNVSYITGDSFEHNGRNIDVKVSDVSVSFSACSNISDIEKNLCLGWSVMQGCPLTNRICIERDNLSMSIESKKFYQIGNRLYNYTEFAFQIFSKLFTYLDKLSVNDYAKWEKALHFYVEGKSSWSTIDIKSINYFVFLDILIKAKKLCRDPLATMLKISPDDASMICKVRNKLIHQEDNLRSAIQKSYTQMNNIPSDFSPIYLNIDGNEPKDPLLFYVNLIMLIDRYIISEIGYSENWNDQSKVLHQLINQ